MSGIQSGVFDHIEREPGVLLDRLYNDRLTQIELLDEAGFYCYHLAEHHTPAVHSMAPSQNVFLGAVSQRTSRLRPRDNAPLRSRRRDGQRCPPARRRPARTARR